MSVWWGWLACRPAGGSADHVERAVVRVPAAPRAPSADDPPLAYVPGKPLERLAPWSSLQPATAPACADNAGYRAIVLAASTWFKAVHGAAEAPGDRGMVAAVRCAPPQNKPTPAERDTCAPWAEQEIRLVAPSVRAVVCLGSFGWAAALKALRGAGYDVPRPLPKFGHGVEVPLSGPGQLTVLGCFHPSQQNTFTGRLTPERTDAVLTRARAIATGAR